MMNNKIKENAIKDYLNGMTNPEVTEKYSLKPCTLKNWLYLANIKKDPSKVNKGNKTGNTGLRYPIELRNKVLDEYFNNSVTQTSLAKKYSIKQTTIAAWVRLNKLKKEQKKTKFSIEKEKEMFPEIEELRIKIYNTLKGEYEVLTKEIQEKQDRLLLVTHKMKVIGEQWIAN